MNQKLLYLVAFGSLAYAYCQRKKVIELRKKIDEIDTEIDGIESTLNEAFKELKSENGE